MVHALAPKKLFDSRDNLLNVLKTDNEHLQHINRDFANIMKEFSIFFFHEAKPLDLKGSRAFVVDELSAAPMVDGVERMGIEADHKAMCRFTDEHAPGYVAVAEAILRYSGEAVKAIPTRWNDERARQRAELDAEIKRLSGMLTHPSMAFGSRAYNSRLLGIMDSTGSLPPRKGPATSQPASPAESDKAPSDSLALRKTKEAPVVLPLGFHPNATFYGMKDELQELHNRLFNSKRRSQGTVAVLLHAGPGAGKSYLAREYMYQNMTRFPGGIFWIDSKTPQQRANGYWQIAHVACELREDKQSPDPTWFANNSFVEKVRLWLESREDWLLIFDGIAFDDDAEITEFKSYLPYRKIPASSIPQSTAR
jgi:hypothetical protein